LHRLAGPLGKVVGLERFGASAPYKVLDEKFGYTAANVVSRVEAYRAEYRATIRDIAALVQQ
jgi:transketolase